MGDDLVAEKKSWIVPNFSTLRNDVRNVCDLAVMQLLRPQNKNI